MVNNEFTRTILAIWLVNGQYTITEYLSKLLFFNWSKENLFRCMCVSVFECKCDAHNFQLTWFRSIICQNRWFVIWLNFSFPWAEFQAKMHHF